jgi:hypothetical protein
MNKWTLVVLLAIGPGQAAGDDSAAPGSKGSGTPEPNEPSPPISQGAPPPPSEGNGLQWIQPSPVPPVATGRAVRGALPAALRAPEPPPDELEGLRAVSLREGHGTIALRGTTRAVQRGDRLGSALVKAVGSDRIILERPARPGGQGQSAREAATMVVTFGPGGEARVRVYVLAGAAAPPPEVR